MEQRNLSTRTGTTLRRVRETRLVRCVSTLSVAILALSVLLSACAPDAGQTAQANKAKLDRELTTARANPGVPESLLAPIVTQEQALAAAAASGSDASNQSAASGYTRLYQQVVALAQMPPDKAKAQANADLQQLQTAIQTVEKQGFVEAAPYHQRMDQAQQQLNAAQATKEYFKVANYVEAQIAAVTQIAPVYQQMQDLGKLVDEQNQALGVVSSAPQPLQCALGANDTFWTPSPTVNVSSQQTGPSYEYQQWPQQDLTLFRAAGSAKEFATLSTLIRAESLQLTASETGLLPTQASNLLQTFQADVQTYQQDGGKDATFSQQAAQDAKTLAATRTLTDYGTLVKTLQQQTQALELPLVKAQAQHDLNTLQALVNQGQQKVTIDPANGVGYPDAYEYANQYTGVGDAAQRLQSAQTLSDYQLVDQEIQMFITNLQAMLQNLNDNTPATSVHQTDLSLIKHYGVLSERVIVVSLREQEARMYDNGVFVKALQVTTGNPDLPSPPGIHCLQEKLQNYNDVSPFPKGSPWYYNPTHINYGMVYSDYGYLIHDAWWRSWFGKYSNLPHYEPISFNNGTHGCINLPTDTMGWLFNWSDIGTPVIVY